MKLVSIIMPTSSRQPYSDLHRALSSIKDNADNFSEVEILLRMDDDDEQRMSMIPELKEKYNATCVVGPRGAGYVNMPLFARELVAVATGQWCWLFDDDAWVEGPWLKRLREMPSDTGVNTEYYNLGNSCYLNKSHDCPAGICVPRELVKDRPFDCPVDDQWMRLVEQKGWSLKLMAGVHYYHEGRAR